MKVLKGCGQFIAIGEYKALREGNTKTKTRQEQSYANNSLKESWQVLESGVRYCNLLLDLATIYVLGTLLSCNYACNNNGCLP